MVKLKLWNNLRHRWWGQPLLWSLVFIPLAGWLSPRIMLPEGKVYLVYLPLAVCISLLMVYDWMAIPGIVIAIMIRYSARLGPEIGIIMTLLYLFCLGVCWLGYRCQTQRDWCARINVLGFTPPRLIWLLAFPPLLFILSLQLTIGMGLLPDEMGMVFGRANLMHTLVNFHALLIAGLSSTPLFYFVLRVLNNPRFLRTLRRRFRLEVAPGVKTGETLLWLLLLAGMVFALCYPTGVGQKEFWIDYSLTLLLPLMLYGAMRFGYHLNCIAWSVALLALFFNYRSYVRVDGRLHDLAVVSSMMLVFTLSVFLLSAINSRQLALFAKMKRASLQDPMVGLPNLRALKRDLALAPRSTLCFLRIAELDLLSRHYGMQLRIRFKQHLASTLRKGLAADEDVYQLPGYDLVLRLNGYDAEAKVAEVHATLENFRLVWNGLPIHPPLGVSYCGIAGEVAHLHLLLGELSSLAELSLTSGEPESIRNDRQDVQNEVKRKVRLLHRVQRALDSDDFILMAQPIHGVRGDSYHEILLRLPDDKGGTLSPNEFLPVVHEFGLAYQLDLWVLNNTLKFMDRHRDTLPSARFAVNISPPTLCRPTLSRDVRQALQQYAIEPYQLILEITESHLMQDIHYAATTLRELRELGCRIAIDDFGTGYASYNRLRMLEVDTLKIDGSFVRNMLNDPIDHQIIASICKVALMKRLHIVAEYVESEEQQMALRALGVDYMQGYHIGRPVPLTSLAADTQAEPA
ncbi:Putative cytochrome C-type biogenesis protein [Serratia rubidaea]|uniref:bifunctional diguanylate cyclase/phosphodiesterase n=1 Tax=Serratia rubidaea TaxID=61652 RepID=UPI0007740C79|nr:EAL domain-containing protein [Serratia rubidaea]AML57477.1 Putative cytochrome C-type biogenesis protein [Serratia rubidaea]